MWDISNLVYTTYDPMWLEHTLQHFHGYARDCMCGALVTFSKKLQNCGKSLLDLWRLDSPFQRADYSVE